MFGLMTFKMKLRYFLFLFDNLKHATKPFNQCSSLIRQAKKLQIHGIKIKTVAFQYLEIILKYDNAHEIRYINIGGNYCRYKNYRHNNNTHFLTLNVFDVFKREDLYDIMVF